MVLWCQLCLQLWEENAPGYSGETSAGKSSVGNTGVWTPTCSALGLFPRLLPLPEKIPQTLLSSQQGHSSRSFWGKRSEAVAWDDSPFLSYQNFPWKWNHEIVGLKPEINNLLQAKQQDSDNMQSRFLVSWVSTSLQRVLRDGKSLHNWVQPLSKCHHANQTGALGATAHFSNTSRDTEKSSHLPGQPLLPFLGRIYLLFLPEFIFFLWYGCNES